MKVRTHSIPPVGGLDVNFVISPAVMQESTSTFHQNDVGQAFTVPVNCQLNLKWMDRDVLVQGNARTTLSPICDRCAETFHMPINLPIFLTCSPEPYQRHPRGSDSYQESEEGVVFFKKPEINLMEIIREQILLTLPMRFLCQKDCKGLCSHCGANLNQGLHLCKPKASNVVPFPKSP